MHIKYKTLITIIAIAALFFVFSQASAKQGLAGKIHPQDFKALQKIAENAGIDVEKFTVYEALPSDFKRNKDGYLMHRRSYFKRKEYKILDSFTSKDHVILVNQKNRIIGLSIGRTKFNNTKLIESLRHLLTAHISNNSISVLDISNHNKLESINASSCGIDEIARLDNLPNLRVLDLSYNRLKRFENVKKLPNLRKLDLGENYLVKIENLNFPQLLDLALSPRGDGRIERMEGLDKLTKLKELQIIGEPIKKLENIDNQKSLESLMLTGTKIKKLENISHMKKLKELWIARASIEKIEGLDKLKSLEKLNLRDNKIKKIEGLDNLSKLKVLKLGGNDSISKVEGLNNLKSLKNLDLMETTVKRIEGLENNLQLVDISLHYTRLEKLENYNHLNKLQILGYDETPVDMYKSSHKEEINELERFLSANRRKE